MNKTNQGVNWNSVKEEFAEAGVSERGVEFLQALCTGADFSQVANADKELATRIVGLSKALKNAEDRKLEPDEVYPRFDRRAIRKEQSDMITNDLRTFRRIMEEEKLGEFSNALEVFSNALCDVNDKLNPIAERIASDVDGVLQIIEGSLEW
jgi:hypothetical protein